MPVVPLQGSLQAVIVWKALTLGIASLLWKVSVCPGCDRRHALAGVRVSVVGEGLDVDRVVRRRRAAERQRVRGARRVAAVIVVLAADARGSGPVSAGCSGLRVLAADVGPVVDGDGHDPHHLVPVGPPGVVGRVHAHRVARLHLHAPGRRRRTHRDVP